VPFFIIRLATGDWLYRTPFSQLQRFGMLFGLLRVMRFDRLTSYIEGDITKQLYNITLQVFSLVLCTAAGFQFVQRTETLADPTDPDRILKA
jgi:hypothetical protein